MPFPESPGVGGLDNLGHTQPHPMQFADFLLSKSATLGTNCQHKKWSADGDKASLAAAQKLLTDTLPTIKSIDGVKGVQRIVCGGCLDFKVVTSLDAAKWGDFESGGHGPEVGFLDKLKAIDGITEVETQTYTIMPL